MTWQYSCNSECIIDYHVMIIVMMSCTLRLNTNMINYMSLKMRFEYDIDYCFGAINQLFLRGVTALYDIFLVLWALFN